AFGQNRENERTGMKRNGSGKREPDGEIPLPAWLPDAARLYLHHIESGVSLRQLALREGVHASTVLRQVRRCETRRDDPLVDGALDRLSRLRGLAQQQPSRKDAPSMTAPIRPDPAACDPAGIDEATLLNEGRR